MIAGSTLVTGATGFIGRHLVDRLAARDGSLVIAVRDAGRCPRHWGKSDSIRIVEAGDDMSAERLNEVGDVDTIVHLAGLAHVSEAAVGAEAFERANVGLTARIAEVARRCGARRFINLSSIAAITSEAGAAVISDASPERPTTAYGRSKRAAEAEVRVLAERGVFAISLRPPLVVGADAGGNWGQLQALAATGLPLPFASVRNARSLIGVDALADIVASLCEVEPDPARSGAYAVAHPDALSLPQMLTLLRRGMGRPPRLFPVPTRLLRLGAVIGLRRQVESLIGDFRIDASRFFEAFPSCRPGSIREDVERSGRDHARARRT